MIKIKEKFSKNEVAIEGSFIDGLQAADNRNEAFRRSGMRGEYALYIGGIRFHVEPHEYAKAIKAFEE